MKRFQQIIAMVLTVMLLLSAVPSTALTAFAAGEGSEYPAIYEGEWTTVEVAEAGQTAYFCFTPEVDGVYAFYSNINRDTEGCIYDLDWNQIAYDDDSGEGYNFRIECAMEAGTTYILGANFLNSESGSFDVQIVGLVAAEEIQITNGDLRGYVGETVRLQVTFAPADCVQEGVEWASNDESVATVNEYGQLNFVGVGNAIITATSENGLVDTCAVTVESIDTIDLDEEKIVTLGNKTFVYFYFTPEEDGYYSFYSYNSDDDTYGYILDSNMNEINRDDDGGEGNNFDVRYELEAGVTYILKARFYDTDDRGSFAVSIKRTKKITGLELVSMPEKTEYIEGHATAGNINYDGLKLRVTWSDGSTTDWEYNGELSINGENLSIYTGDFTETGIVRLAYGESEVVLAFTLVEDPIDRIELVTGTAEEYVENYNGWINESENGEYFHYSSEYPWDASVRIVFKDGTSTVANVGDYVDGYRVDWNHNQYNEPWVVGTENKSYIKYLGHTVLLPITVRENRVAGIELVTGTESEYVENYNGWIDENENGEFFHYSTIYPDDASVRILFKDGTSTVANVGDYVDGYRIDWDYDQYEEPWVVGTENKAYIKYLGHTVLLPITVRENTVASIEVVSGKITCVENADGYEGENGYHYSYSIPEDVAIKINYKDGTSKTVGVDESVDGYWFSTSSNQDEVPWVVGDDNWLTVSYLGAETRIPVSVIANPVDHIELVTGTEREYVENTNGRLEEDEDTGEAFYYYYTYTPWDASVRIIFKDGTSTVANVGDYVDGYYIDWDYNQYEEPWVVGTENKSYIKYMGHTVLLPITVRENRVAGIELVTGTEREYVENYDGWINENKNGEYFHYDTETPSDASVRIIFKDGTSTIANVGDYVDGYYIGWSHNQYEEPWVVGTENKSYIEYLGYSVLLPITVCENKVASIELLSGTEREYMENTNGCLEEDEETGEVFYRYYTHDHSDASVRIIFKDGTSTIANVGEYVDGYYIGWNSNQYSEPWVIGTENKSYIEYLGHKVLLPITVRENTVASIELVSGKITCIENVNGYEGENGYYYDYSIPEDVAIKINYKDGTSKTVGVGEEVDGYWVSTSSNQDEVPWVLGDDNWLTVSYLGAETRIPVSIIANPVDHIELVTGTEREYVENYDGWIDENENGEFFYYRTSAPWDASVRIVFKDGTSTVAYVGDYVDGYHIGWDSNQYIEPWVVGTENKAYIKYLGHTVLLPITVRENRVASMELVTGTESEYVENYNGWINENENGEYFHYNTFYPNDASVRIVFKDGTSTVAYVGEFVDGYRIDWDYDQYEEPWVVGTENKAYIQYLGHTVLLPITVRENKVASIELVTGKVTCLENTDGYEGENGYYYDYAIPEDVSIKINYKDGTSKTVGMDESVDGYWFSTSSNQDEVPWVLGDDNWLTVSYLGAETRIPVSVIVNPAERIELITAPTRSYVYGDETFGYLYPDGAYRFRPYDLTGLSFMVYYTDGTTKTFTNADIKGTFELNAGGGNTIDGYFCYMHYESYPAQIGDFPVTFEYMGKTFTYTVELTNHQHEYDDGYVEKKPTCAEAGVMVYTCASCGETKTESIEKLTTHSYAPVVTAATFTTDGSIVEQCGVCGDVASTTAINAVNTATLSATSYIYDGKAKTPAVTVKDTAGKVLVNGTDYTVSYAGGRKALGTYNVVVTLKGNYSGTKTLSFTIGLAMPTATAANAANGVKITWNAIAGAKDYKVYKSVYANGAWSGWTCIKTGVTDTSYTDASVKSADNVRYTVRAFNGNYSSAYQASNAIKFLATPTVKAANAVNGVKISWNAVGGAKSYTIYKSVYSGGKWSGWKAIKTGVTTTTYTDTTVKSANNVKYTVRAVNGKYASSYTSSNSIKFLATPTVKAANAVNGVKISWNAVGGAKSYTIYKSVYSGGKWSGWKAIKTGVTTTTYTDTTVKSANNVKYTVRAVNGKHASSYTSSNSIKFLATPTVKVANAAKGVTVTWNKIAGAKTYTVYRSVYSGGKWSGWKAVKTGVTGTTYTDTAVKSGATVRYTVKAINGSFASNIKASATTKFLAQPAAKVAKTTKGLKISWGKSAGATGYIVYRRTYTNGKWSGWTAVKTTSALSYTDTTAKAGVTYQYAVRAYSGSYKSSYTNSASIKR